MLKLPWPQEFVGKHLKQNRNWSDNHANIVLDFHGKLNEAVLTVFSDGNHHMALEQCLQEFSQQELAGRSIFYLTLPPGVLTQIINNAGVRIGNLELELKPDIIIGPIEFVNQYHSQLNLDQPSRFAYSLGNSFVFRKNQTMKIKSMYDLFNSDIRFFISNPIKEKASYQVYLQTIQNLAKLENIDLDTVDLWLNNNQKIVFGQNVHHREAAEVIHNKQADIALLYHHLALRYVRIFPDQFSMQTFYDSGSKNHHSAHITTNYYICAANSTNAVKLKQFFLSSQAAQIYESHGLGA